MRWTTSIFESLVDAFLEIREPLWWFLTFLKILRRLVSFDLCLKGIEPIVNTHMDKIKSLCKLFGESGLTRSWFTDKQNLWSWGSGIINKILLSTSHEVIIFDSLRGSMLIEWPLHHFNKGFLFVCFSDTFGVKRFSSSNLSLSLLFSFNDFVNTFKVILISI
jgi:hypothetical protein